MCWLVTMYCNRFHGFCATSLFIQVISVSQSGKENGSVVGSAEPNAISQHGRCRPLFCRQASHAIIPMTIKVLVTADVGRKTQGQEVPDH